MVAVALFDALAGLVQPAGQVGRGGGQSSSGMTLRSLFRLNVAVSGLDGVSQLAERRQDPEKPTVQDIYPA